MKMEEKKKTGPKGKAGKGPAEWVRPCIYTMRTTAYCSAPLHLRLLLLEKRGSTLHA